MSDTRIIIGLGAALLAVLVAFGMPVASRRVNQGIVTLLLAVLIFVAAFSLFDLPTSLIAAVAVLAVIVIVRDVLRFVRHAVYGVTKYTRRDYWYRQVGRSILGSHPRASRWRW